MAAWRSFVRVAAGTLTGLVLLCYGFVLAVDPYDNLPFSPDFDRKQITTSQRFFYPAMARDSRFDSAIIGNSSVRLLRPDQLNELLDGKFVNLGMNAASSWEQQQIFNVFQRNHSTIKNVLIGMEYNWCREEVDPKFIGNTTAEDFPEWMYDEQTFNNLPRLNTVSLQHAWKQLMILAGVRESRFGDDGYTVFTKPGSEYDIEKARLEIYSSPDPLELEPQIPPFEMNSSERSQIPLPALSRLQSMLNTLPVNTRKILLFMPLHSFRQARPGSRQESVWNECKKRTVEIASRGDNIFVLDFMIRSAITRTDSNYWDSVHYTVEVAETLGKHIGTGVNQRFDGPDFKLLYAPVDDPN